MSNLKEYLIKVVKEYQVEKRFDLKGNLLAKFVRDEAENLFPEEVLKSGNYIIKASVGQGQWADVPWLAILDSEVTSSARTGYYIVYLFDKSGEGVYLTLNQGYTYFKENYSRSNAVEEAQLVSNYWISKLPLISANNSKGFEISNLDLKSNESELAKGYEHCNIYSKYYSLLDLERLSVEELLEDVKELLLVYRELKSVLKSEGLFLDKNQYIIENYSLETLEEVVSEKFNSGSIKIGVEVDIPKNLNFKEKSSINKSRKKIDYIAHQVKSTLQGEMTEDLVLKIEKERISSIPESATKIDEIRRVSKEGDGDGYDILSFDYDYITSEIVEIFIEVKSTLKGKEEPFYFTDNELNVAKDKGKYYWIYRLFKENNDWNYYIIKNAYANLLKAPVIYKALPK